MSIILGGSTMSYKNIKDYFGKDKFSPKEYDLLNKVSLILIQRGVDADTSVSILKSFENKIFRGETVFQRLSSFDKFLARIHPDIDLIDTLRDYGLMTNKELEEDALQTGNWIPFMKKVYKEKSLDKKEIINDNKKNELGPKADVQLVSNK